jgi:hypothetical protein
MTVQNKFTRRAVVKRGLLLSAFVPALGLMGNTHAATADLAPLDPKDPAAVTLGFVNEVSKVDTAANPRYAPGQKCANCQQFLGKPSDTRGGCVLFPGKSVPAAGWCNVWRPIP